MDAVAVGVNTVLLDDPLLTSRLATGRSPVKVVFDSVARTPADGQTVRARRERGRAQRPPLHHRKSLRSEGVQNLKDAGAVVVTLPTRREARSRSARPCKTSRTEKSAAFCWRAAGTLRLGLFRGPGGRQGCLVHRPKLLGGGGSSPLGGLGVASMAEAITLLEIQTEKLGDDLLITGRVRYPDVENTDNTPNDAAEVA